MTQNKARTIGPHSVLRNTLTTIAKVISSSLLMSVMVSHGVAAKTVSERELQRVNYEKAQDLLDKKKVEEYQALRSTIATYPLTPYTDYRAFLAQLSNKTPPEVDNFIEKNRLLPFSSRIRAPYLEVLAKQGQWQTLLTFQTQEPKGESYQCIYYHALWMDNQKEAAFSGAEKLWLSGQGIADQCDPLFEQWEEAGLRSDALILDRMLLAFEARNGKLMTYLMKLPKSDAAKKQAEAMKVLYRKPESVTQFAKQHEASDFYRSQTEFAFKKLARKDVSAAQKALPKVVNAQKLSSQKSQQLAEYVAFRLTNTDSDELAKWRDQVLLKTERVVLLERRVRLAIQHADWQGVQRWIARLPEVKRSAIRWQYWQGRSEIELGEKVKGQQRLKKLVGKRNFYSVAAANAVKQSINYPTTTLVLDKAMVNPHRMALERIRELIDLDKIAAAKSEWRWLLSYVSSDEKEMLAAYAAVQGWHHLTVTATISARMWDNTHLRFPIAHRWWFNFYGEKHDINPITLMSLARQESALDIEARSPVGARGIMQIMPATAKYTAKKYRINYQGKDDLYEVGKNIEIGSHYLDGLLEQYDHNRIFALAAYNAGPHRVKTWRARTGGELDAYAFIEAIPFKETRGYVQNILMFETYYRDILGVEGTFLSGEESNAKY
ncbi:murein transglycosylase [Vibrio sp. 03-59-1]|uniref:murein transglycosylase n=1 Tax=Vibrio sp. 03-59-1 TaxID=2607607 RepID=UPI001493AF2C|nr:murein transglycosylase [Vibrio sp. 03-59-1]NOH83444.1 murein transglycosylase [Vibrio sp. 03-59-1]